MYILTNELFNSLSYIQIKTYNYIVMKICLHKSFVSLSLFQSLASLFFFLLFSLKLEGAVELYMFVYKTFFSFYQRDNGNKYGIIYLKCK